MTIFGEILKLCQAVCESVSFYKMAEKAQNYPSFSARDADFASAGAEFSPNDVDFAIAGAEFSAKDVHFSMNAREVWSPFVDTDGMIKVGMFSFKSF